MGEIWEPYPKDWPRHQGIIVPGDPDAPDEKFWKRPFLKVRLSQVAILEVPDSRLKVGYFIGYTDSRGRQMFYAKALTSPKVALLIGRKARHFFAFDPMVVTNEVPLKFRKLMPVRNVRHYRYAIFIHY